MGEGDEEAREHPVKEDWNCATEPPLVRKQRHPDDVAELHCQQVQVGEVAQSAGIKPPGLDEEAVAAREIEADSPVLYPQLIEARERLGELKGKRTRRSSLLSFQFLGASGRTSTPFVGLVRRKRGVQ